MLMVTFLQLSTPCTKLMGNGTGGLMQAGSFGRAYMPTRTPHSSTMPESIILLVFLFLREALLLSRLQ